MTGVAVARSSFLASLTRYSHSRGLWLLLVIAPVGARFMIAQDDGFGMQVAIRGHLPVMTSATLGVTLGIVVSTLLLPVGFLYLRSNVTRSQPWQIEELTAAPRVAIGLGRFAADMGVLFAMLTALTFAGWFLGWMVGSGPLDIGRITYTLWVVAAPSLMVLAAIRILLDALPILRGGLGDAMFFLVWMTALAVPAVASALPSSYGANLLDMAGFVRPLAGAAPMTTGAFTIGFTRVLPGRVPLDAMAGVAAAGYLASRLTWALIAIGLAAVAGLLYRPHLAVRSVRKPGVVAGLRASAKPVPADSAAQPAVFAANRFLNLVKAEFRLIGGSRPQAILAGVAAPAGMIGEYRQYGSPAAILVLLFGLSAHAGRSEAMRMFTRTAVLCPAVRRIAFVVAGTTWALLMAVPNAIVHVSAAPLLLALGIGMGAAVIAIGLAAISRSAFAPRLVLLVVWYGYFATAR